MHALFRNAGLSVALVVVSAIPAAGYSAPDEDRAEVVIAGDYFGAGGALEPGASVEGDAFVAGGEVALRVPVGGDAVLSGGTVNVAERVGEDLYAAGGSVVVDAQIVHNARIAGGRVQITRRSTIAGKATLAGAKINVEGKIGRQLSVFAGSVVLDGQVAGDVTVAARSLVVGPNARIAGRLTYRGPAPADVSPQAVIGKMNYVPFSFDDKRWQPVARAFAWAGALAFTVGLFLLGALAILLLPETSAVAGRVVRARPIASLGLGFGLVICIPVAAILFIATVIGIPIGFALLFAWPVMLIFGYLAGVMSLSDGFAALIARGNAGRGLRIGLLAIALAVLLLLVKIPFAGWIVGPLLLITGLGAITLAIVAGRRAWAS